MSIAGTIESHKSTSVVELAEHMEGLFVQRRAVEHPCMRSNSTPIRWSIGWGTLPWECSSLPREMETSANRS